LITNTNMKKTAIILGATGLTGSLLLDELLEDSLYEKVKLFSRSSVEKNHPKIEEYLVDLLDMDSFASDFRGDVVFCCIGTTKAKTPDKEQYKNIDYGIPVNAAKLAEQNKIPIFIVISALGADPNSSVFYNKLKGEMQTEVLKYKIDQTYILQPSLISGQRNEKRFGEDLANALMKVFGFLVPKKYKRISASTIAKAMQILATKGYPETIVSSPEIKTLVESPQR